MTLFGLSSPNVRKVVIALHEMALPYALEHVAVFRGQQFDADIVALSPIAKVPILADPDGPAGGKRSSNPARSCFILRSIMARHSCRHRAHTAMPC